MSRRARPAQFVHCRELEARLARRNHHRHFIDRRARAICCGPEGLRPGDCSWVDRPIDVRTIDERWFLIRFETEANAQLKETLHGSKVDTSPTAAERYPDARTIPAYMNDPNHYWSFFGVKKVYNSYVATGHGYWKPFLEVVRPVDSKRPNRDNPYLIPKKP